MQDWQSLGALAVVLVTALVFIVRAMKRSKKQGGCGSGCGCEIKKRP